MTRSRGALVAVGAMSAAIGLLAKHGVSLATVLRLAQEAYDREQRTLVVCPYPICEHVGCVDEAITSDAGRMLCGLHAFPSVCDCAGCNESATEVIETVMLCAAHAREARASMEAV